MWSTAISNEQFATYKFLTAENRVLQVEPIDSALQNSFHGMLTPYCLQYGFQKSSARSKQNRSIKDKKKKSIQKL